MKTSPPAKRILLVDDEPEVRQILVWGFEMRGIQTLQADGGINALALLAKESSLPDAVISDIRMPGGNGLEFLAGAKKLYPTLPVFLVTGFSDLSAEEAARLGADGLFHKPFHVTKLVDEILEKLGAPAKKTA